VGHQVVVPVVVPGVAAVLVAAIVAQVRVLPGGHHKSNLEILYTFRVFKVFYRQHLQKLMKISICDILVTIQVCPLPRLECLSCKAVSRNCQSRFTLLHIYRRG